jgi:hypothetical protein
VSVHVYPDTGHAARPIGASASRPAGSRLPAADQLWSTGLSQGCADRVARAEGRSAERVGAGSGDTATRYDGNNCCGAGQDPDRRPLKDRLRETLRAVTVHPQLLDRLAGKSWQGKRSGGCGTPILSVVKVRSKDGRAYCSGIETCKSRLCPCCGPRIGARRAEDFGQAIGRWHDLGPDHHAWFVRLSAQNAADIPLAEGVARATKGFERLRNRKLWRDLRERYGLHYLKVREETHGSNGWNVHLQMVLATVSDDPGLVLYDLNRTLRKLWPDVMGRLGYFADPRYAVDVKQVEAGTAEAIGSYMAKETAWDIGSELALGSVKLGRREGQRTYEQVVVDYADRGDQVDLTLIREYHDAIYGKRHCSWSEGFRELLGLAAEQSDEELAEADSDGDTVAAVDGRAYYRMLRRCQVPGLLAAAERGGVEAMRGYVRKLGYPPDCVAETWAGLARTVARPAPVVKVKNRMSTCAVPGCAKPARFYICGDRCDDHRPVGPDHPDGSPDVRYVRFGPRNRPSATAGGSPAVSH